MDTVTAATLVIIIFALIIIAAFVIFPTVRAKITGPFKTGLDIEGSREERAADPPASSRPGIRGKDIKSRSGGLLAEDQTGQGLDMEQIEVEDDVLLSSRDAQQDQAPKDPPPA